MGGMCEEVKGGIVEVAVVMDDGGRVVTYGFISKTCTALNAPSAP